MRHLRHYDTAIENWIYIVILLATEGFLSRNVLCEEQYAFLNLTLFSMYDHWFCYVTRLAMIQCTSLNDSTQAYITYRFCS